MSAPPTLEEVIQHYGFPIGPDKAHAIANGIRAHLQSESGQENARTRTEAVPGERAPESGSRESRNQEPGRSDPGSTRRGCVRDRAIESNRAKPAADLPNQAGEVTQETRENRGLQSPELTNRLVTTGTKRGVTGTAIPVTPSHSTTDQGELL